MQNGNLERYSNVYISNTQRVYNLCIWNLYIYYEGILIAYVKITHLIINASLQTQGKGHNLKIPQVAISEGEVIRGIFLFSLIQIEYDVKMYKQTNQEIHILIFDSHNTNTIFKNPTNVYIRWLTRIRTLHIDI